MAGTFTRLLVHLVFSTKNRKDLIPEEVEPDLFAYIGGICRRGGSRLLSAGGTANHVHLLVVLSKTMSLSDLMLEIKRDSSTWMNKGQRCARRFGWQDGFGGFTIGESGVAGVQRYIARQKAHHKRVSFEDEFVAFLKKYMIEYDPKYVWD